MFWIIVSLIAGSVMLYFGSEWLVRGAKGIALRLGITPFIIGLTVLAFGSSAPEAITSIVSSDTPEIIMGNVVGSNIANIGLAIGLAAVVGPMAAMYKDMKLEICTMLIVEAGLCLLALLGYIGIIEGIIMMILLFVFIFVVFKLKGSDKEAREAYEEDVTEETLAAPWLVVLVIVGLVLLYFGAKFFIQGAKDLAELMGASDLLIGLFVVAIGTSLPEICISVIAARRGEADMAVANIVGSNIFNILFVLAIGSMLTDIPVTESTLTFHLPVMLIFAVVMFLMVRFRNRIGRGSGMVLIGMYAVYIAIMAFVPSLMS
jgi:cation:H+ antiporter